tara:strand:- start:4625 stop:5368 length:744 start_codon:yes stop_codon:yes gene_type:complete
MNPDLIIKKHLQILGGIIVVWFLFADDFLLGQMPKDIRRFKSSIKKYTEEKRKFEDLVATRDSVKSSIEESNENLRDLFDRFPKEGTAENNINATVTKITEQIIVQNDQLKPKVTKEYIAKGVDTYSVPEVKSGDMQMQVDNSIMISSYVQEMEIRCNYFELLKFLHDITTQDLYFLVTELALKPYKDLPYGIDAKVSLLTFGFEGFKDREQNDLLIQLREQQSENESEEEDSSEDDEESDYEEEFY